MLKITGYPDRYSVAPGEKIAFKISLEEADRRRLRRKVDRHRFQVELGLKDFEEWRASYLARAAVSEAAI